MSIERLLDVPSAWVTEMKEHHQRTWQIAGKGGGVTALWIVIIQLQILFCLHIVCREIQYKKQTLLPGFKGTQNKNSVTIWMMDDRSSATCSSSISST